MTLLAPDPRTPAGTGPRADVTSARMVALVHRASGVLATTWPIESFIAVNPLAGLEHLGFEEAAARAAELFGAPGALSLETYRQLHAEGRIGSGDLRAAARGRLGDLADALVGPGPDGTATTALDIVVADLVAGVVPAPTPDPPRTPAGWCDARFGTALAPVVDAESSRWAALAVGSDSGRWDPPGLDGGLYAAWRDLVTWDRGLPRDVRHRFRGAAPDAGVALADALDWCDGDAEAVAVLTGHLLAQPGWASLLHGRGTVELVGYLALRLTLERALVGSAVGLDPVLAGREAWSPGSDAVPDDRRLDDALTVAGPGVPVPAHGRRTAAAALGRVPVTDRPWVWLEAHERRVPDGAAGPVGPRPAVTGAPPPVRRRVLHRPPVRGAPPAPRD